MTRQAPDISIIIPAFNEAKRLPPFLDTVVSFCKGSRLTYEIVVVDDGSTDRTFAIAASYRSRFIDLRVCRIRRNRGKGYAVKKGLFISRGNICVFLDADGSVEPHEIEKNLRYITEEGYDIFVGSRVLRDESRVLRAKWYRKLMGLIFVFLVHTFLFKKIKDTQCGFKMFKKEIVKPLFSRIYLRRFSFDIEMLYLAFKMGYKVKEGPVSWHHVKGSKVNLLTDPLKMSFDILRIRNWHCTPINPLNKYLGPDEYAYMYEMEQYHWWFVSRNNLIKELIRSLRVQDPKMLDIGCGTGNNLINFGTLGTIFGLDISSQALAFCAKRGLRDIVVRCPVEKTAFRDKVFDIVTCLEVLEHLQDPVEALRELRRVLKDTGKIIIAVPAFRTLWSQHDEALCHLRRYRADSLLSDAEEAGLKVEKTGYFFFTSFFIVAPIRILRKFLETKKRRAHSDTTTVPPKLLNEFLKILFAVEAKVSLRFGLPIGTTLYAVVSKRP